MKIAAEMRDLIRHGEVQGMDPFPLLWNELRIHSFDPRAAFFAVQRGLPPAERILRASSGSIVASPFGTLLRPPFLARATAAAFFFLANGSEYSIKRFLRLIAILLQAGNGHMVEARHNKFQVKR